MSELFERLMLEPVFFVGTALAVVTDLAAQGIIDGPYAVGASIILAALLRQVVTPASKGQDIFDPGLDDPHHKGKR